MLLCRRRWYGVGSGRPLAGRGRRWCHFGSNRRRFLGRRGRCLRISRCLLLAFRTRPVALFLFFLGERGFDLRRLREFHSLRTRGRLSQYSCHYWIQNCTRESAQSANVHVLWFPRCRPASEMRGCLASKRNAGRLVPPKVRSRLLIQPRQLFKVTRNDPSTWTSGR